jgi:glutamine cyclotransferase
MESVIINNMRLYLIFFIVLLSLSCDEKQNRSNTNSMAANKTSGNSTNMNSAKTFAGVPVYTYEIVNAFKHDPKAFTEGLFFHNGFLYESTGQEEKSNLRKVELETGKIVQQYNIPKESFGEGTTVLKDKIYQLTWQDGTAYVYEDSSFKLLRELNYEGEGWGLTNDGTNLIMSDGSHLLKFIDPETFKTVRTVAVLQADGKPLFLLNELEYIKGEIWANIWHSEENETGTTQGRLPNIGKPNYVVRIDPNSGKILSWVDLAAISPDDSERNSENTLNGIAYDEATDRIFVTGKNWKKLLEIKVKAR